MMGDGYGMAGMSGFWWLGLLVLVGVAVLLLAVVRVLSGGITGRASIQSADRPSELGEARRILDERYARRELSTEEYHEQERIQGLGQKV